MILGVMPLGKMTCSIRLGIQLNLVFVFPFEQCQKPTKSSLLNGLNPKEIRRQCGISFHFLKFFEVSSSHFIRSDQPPSWANSWLQVLHLDTSQTSSELAAWQSLEPVRWPGVGAISADVKCFFFLY